MDPSERMWRGLHSLPGSPGQQLHSGWLWSWAWRGSGAIPHWLHCLRGSLGRRVVVGRTARLSLGYQTRHRTCGCMGVPRAQWNAFAKAAKFCSEPSTLWEEEGV